MSRQSFRKNQLINQLQQLQIHISSFDQLKIGFKLIQIANKLLYQGNNHTLISKAISTDPNRAGNNVININILLKHLKNDSRLSLPDFVKEMTSFSIVQDEEKRQLLIQWMLNTYLKQNNQNNQEDSFQKLQVNKQNKGMQRSTLNNFVQMQIDSNPKQRQENEFQNLYFASNMKIIKNQQFQSLVKFSDQSEKVLKKGSFKLLKPKLSFSQQMDNATPKQIEDIQQKKSFHNKYELKNQTLKVTNQNQPSELKEISMIQNSNMNISAIQEKSLQIQSSVKNQERKTISKKAMKPPLYKSINKQNQKQTVQKRPKNNIKQQSNHILLSDFNQDIPPNKIIESIENIQCNSLHQYTKSISAKKQQLKHELLNLQLQIAKEKQDYYQHSLDNTYKKNSKEQTQIKERHRSRTLKSQRKSSNRKVFKMQIVDISLEQKAKIIQWLMLINLVPKNTKDIDQIQNRAINGVIFVQICNYYIGRSKCISYFKQPKKSAQIHSNFQKIFNFLHQIPTFSSQLIFQYQYFIPFAQSAVIWNFFKSLYLTFIKSKSLKSQLIQNYQSQIKSQSVKLLSQTKSKQNSFHYSNNQQIKSSQNIKSGTCQKNKHKNMSSQKGSIHSTIQFVKQIPIQMQHKDLIQNIQPNQDATFPIDQSVTSGYKQIYLRKSLNLKQSTILQTPKKHRQSSISNSLKKSGTYSSNSLKKIQNNQYCSSIPKITLQMQMKVLKWIKENQYSKYMNNDHQQLFKDPIRNGFLINAIITKELRIEYNYYKYPKSIQNCRKNYLIGLLHLTNKFSDFPKNFTPFVQQILKGEKQLFYGIIFYLLKLNKNICKFEEKQETSKIENENYIFFHKNMDSAIEQFNKDYMNWIRFLEKTNLNIAHLKIRTEQSLFASISKGLFLYFLTEGILAQSMKIKPTYDNPVTLMQKQANIRKIITYLIQNNLLKSQMFMLSKMIAKKDDNSIRTLLNKIIPISIKSDQFLKQKQRRQEPVNFIKYVKNSLNRKKSRENLQNQQNINKEQIQPNSQKQNKSLASNLNTETNQNIQIQIPWMRKLGYTQNLMLNDGVLLCRLIARFTRENIQIIEHSNLSKPQCLSNIRRALKLLPNCKWDQLDIYEADDKLNIDIYNFIREKFKHSYEMNFKK